MFVLVSYHPGIICLKLEQRGQYNIEAYVIVQYIPNTKFIQGLKEKNRGRGVEVGGLAGGESTKEHMSENL